MSRPAPVREAIRACIKSKPGGATIKDIRAATGCTSGVIYDAVWNMRNAGQIFTLRMWRRALYFLTQADMDAVSQALMKEEAERSRVRAVEKRARKLVKDRVRAAAAYAKKPKPPKKPRTKTAKTAAAVVLAKPKAPQSPKARGPAYLDGPLIFTDQTRRVVYPSKPAPMRTNTHAA